MGVSELTGLPRRKCKDILKSKDDLKHRGTENTEEGGGRREDGGGRTEEGGRRRGRESYKRVLLKHGLREPCYGTRISDMEKIVKRDFEEQVSSQSLVLFVFGR